MLTEDLIDVTIDVFGGYCPAVVPVNLPPGSANVANDVIFPEAGVRTRGGLKKYTFDSVTQITPGASINGLKTYLTPSGGQRFMIWDSLGEMFVESPEAELRNIGNRPYRNLLYESQTLFGREYQAFFNSAGGFDIPRQFDDTHWDRVSQCGPGAAPTAGDENISQAITASPNGLQVIGTGTTLNVQSAVQVGFQITIVLSFGFSDAIPSAFKAGDQWLVAGVGAGYNGTWPISTCVQSAHGQITITYFSNVSGLAPLGVGGTAAIPYYKVFNAGGTALTPPAGVNVVIAGAGVGGYNGTWQVRYASSLSTFVIIIPGAFALANSGNGTWAISGNIDAGLHQVSVAFITRQGAILQAAPNPFTWNAAGGKRAIIGNIATGPPNIQARLLLFTPVITPPATTGTFYSLPSGSSQLDQSSVMLIPDNVTTQVTVNFEDTILQSGFNAEYLFSELELGECAFFIPYNSRGVWLGERAKVPNFVNLSFDGGFLGAVPEGWTIDPDNGAGGRAAVLAGAVVDWGDAYLILGDGATAIRGKIAQSAYQDYLKVPIVQPNTSYSVRARIALGNTSITQGSVHINLSSVSGAFTTAGLTVLYSDLIANQYQEFTASLTGPLANPPSDLLLNLYVDGTPTNGGFFIVDSIEVFATNTPYNSSIARLSRAFNPESFDSVTGQVQIRPGDGQQLRAGFPLRNSLYLAKDHYLGYVTDDGVNEPASWAFTEVSATTGICGPNAVDWNEEWATFAERSGLYICWGSDPVKLTPEIQIDGSFQGRTSWASINWAAASTIWVRIDRVNRMILVGAPINGATTPNIVFMMDYRWLDSAEDIASSPCVAYSGFSGKILSHGRGRKWALWSMTANSMWFAERADGTAQPFFGSGNSDSLLWEQFDCAEQPIDNLTDPVSGNVAGFQIPFSYQTYATPSTQEELQYQLRAHRKLFGYLKFLVWGQGAVNIYITASQRSTILRPYNLAIIPFSDGGRPVNIHGERFFITFSYSTTAITYMQLERITACIKKDAAFLVRGVSS